MNYPNPLYYRARPDQTVFDLPVFFGHVAFQDDRVRGKHYRAGKDPADLTYLIGYYWLDQPADEFVQKFEAAGLLQITEGEFNRLLDKWTRDGLRPAFCWNPEASHKFEQAESTRPAG